LAIHYKPVSRGEKIKKEKRGSVGIKNRKIKRVFGQKIFKGQTPF
jgi:hypothetical protein